MTKRMLIDATHEEETRVAISDGNKLVEYDYEAKNRKPLKGNIFLAKVTRVEPSLQAAFVNFGGNRHGFLPFSEIHPDYFRIPVEDREALIAEQEALLKEHDEEEEAEEDKDEDVSDDAEEEEGIDEDDEDHEDDEDVEEVGGIHPDAGDDEDDDDTSSKGKAKPSKSEKDDEDEDGKSSDHDVKSGDDDPSSDEEKDVSEESDDQDSSKNNGRRGRGRGRRYRGGRGRNKRSAYRNKNVEVVGGEGVEDGGSGFRFNLRRKYKIQEVIKRGQIMLIQVSKEERGNKGAAVSTYLSLAGRYCVLMPNSPRAGGVSRKIANQKDRARMRDVMKYLEVPKGMSVILRTAGVTRTKTEIKRDLDYLLRLWDNIRELTLQSSAPALIYEEADLIKRSIRDLYSRDVEEVYVSGADGYKNARDFMKMMIPSHAKKVQHYEDEHLPLFTRYQVETQISEIGMSEVRLKSGGYLVINPTEALVAIDVNSGKATKERHIEETALKTNLEAAEEVARQLKLRDLGGLVVVDFIDMEDRRNNGKVERKMRDALSKDRARVQVGRISSFGLMELSRQRLNPSLTEAQYQTCDNCKGAGLVRTSDAMSIFVLRAVEEEGIRGRAAQIIVRVCAPVALYLLNNKRKSIADIESRYDLEVLVRIDDEIGASEYRVEVSKPADKSNNKGDSSQQDDEQDKESSSSSADYKDDDNKKSGRRRRGRRGGRGRRNRDADDNQQQSKSDNDNQKDDEKKSKESKSDKDDSAQDQKSSEKDDKSDDKKSAKPRGRKPKDKDADSKGKGKSDDKSDAKKDESPKPSPKEASKDEDKKAKSEDKKPAAKSKSSAPKKAAAPKAAAAKKAEKVPETVPAQEYETVNAPPERKKKGWWSKFKD